jgi:glycerol-3-phosphate acyltransferase PlsX|tara:strand:- start:1176 stop:2165 length:990 start_codon:yes stop_codon:yes gene_type:complete
MGGDSGIQVTVPASLQALKQFPDLHLHLVGDQPSIKSLLGGLPAEMTDRLHLLHTDETISAREKPANVLRSSKGSSMYLAAGLVKSGDVKAMVSAGNTGALLMIGRYLLKTLNGIDKPAIVASIPGAFRQAYLLDVGANVDCTAEQLFQFGVMGSVLAESLSPGHKVAVGLLNIGVEDYKGSDQVRQAAKMLESCEELNYIGYVEANALFEGIADVVVCNGFVGNVTIKSSAGVANVVSTILSEQIAQNWFNRVTGFMVRPMLDKLRWQTNPQRFNGASLLGLQGSIVKSHGNTNIEGFIFAIQQAINEVDNAVPQLIAKKVEAIIQAN